MGVEMMLEAVCGGGEVFRLEGSFPSMAPVCTMAELAEPGGRRDGAPDSAHNDSAALQCSVPSKR